MRSPIYESSSRSFNLRSHIYRVGPSKYNTQLERNAGGKFVTKSARQPLHDAGDTPAPHDYAGDINRKRVLSSGGEFSNSSQPGLIDSYALMHSYKPGPGSSTPKDLSFDKGNTFARDGKSDNDPSSRVTFVAAIFEQGLQHGGDDESPAANSRRDTGSGEAQHSHEAEYGHVAYMVAEPSAADLCFPAAPAWSIHKTRFV